MLEGTPPPTIEEQKNHLWKRVQEMRTTLTGNRSALETLGNIFGQINKAQTQEALVDLEKELDTLEKSNTAPQSATLEKRENTKGEPIWYNPEKHGEAEFYSAPLKDLLYRKVYTQEEGCFAVTPNGKAYLLDTVITELLFRDVSQSSTFFDFDPNLAISKGLAISNTTTMTPPEFVREGDVWRKAKKGFLFQNQAINEVPTTSISEPTPAATPNTEPLTAESPGPVAPEPAPASNTPEKKALLDRLDAVEVYMRKYPELVQRYENLLNNEKQQVLSDLSADNLIGLEQAMNEHFINSGSMPAEAQSTAQDAEPPAPPAPPPIPADHIPFTPLGARPTEPPLTTEGLSDTNPIGPVNTSETEDHLQVLHEAQLQLAEAYRVAEKTKVGLRKQIGNFARGVWDSSFVAEDGRDSLTTVTDAKRAVIEAYNATRDPGTPYTAAEALKLQQMFTDARNRTESRNTLVEKIKSFQQRNPTLAKGVLYGAAAAMMLAGGVNAVKRRAGMIIGGIIGGGINTLTSKRNSAGGSAFDTMSGAAVGGAIATSLTAGGATILGRTLWRERLKRGAWQREEQEAQEAFEAIQHDIGSDEFLKRLKILEAKHSANRHARYTKNTLILSAAAGLLGGGLSSLMGESADTPSTSGQRTPNNIEHAGTTTNSTNTPVQSINTPINQFTDVNVVKPDYTNQDFTIPRGRFAIPQTDEHGTPIPDAAYVAVMQGDGLSQTLERLHDTATPDWFQQEIGDNPTSTKWAAFMTKIGAYNAQNVADSLVVHPGETVGFNDNGELILSRGGHDYILARPTTTGWETGDWKEQMNNEQFMDTNSVPKKPGSPTPNTPINTNSTGTKNNNLSTTAVGVEQTTTSVTTPYGQITVPTQTDQIFTPASIDAVNPSEYTWTNSNDFLDSVFRDGQVDANELEIAHEHQSELIRAMDIDRSRLQGLWINNGSTQAYQTLCKYDWLEWKMKGTDQYLTDLKVTSGKDAWIHIPDNTQPEVQATGATWNPKIHQWEWNHTDNKSAPDNFVGGRGNRDVAGGDDMYYDPDTDTKTPQTTGEKRPGWWKRNVHIQFNLGAGVQAGVGSPYGYGGAQLGVNIGNMNGAGGWAPNTRDAWGFPQYPKGYTTTARDVFTPSAQYPNSFGGFFSF